MPKNKGLKVCLHQGEYSINLDVLKISVKNNYLLAKQQCVLKEHIDIFTHPKHKEITLGAHKEYKNLMKRQ